MNLTEEKIYKIIESYFEKYSISEDHIASYNDFITNKLIKIIQNESGLKVKLKEKVGKKGDEVDKEEKKKDERKYLYVQLFFGQVFVEYPYYYNKNQKRELYYPFDARKRKTTYDAEVKVNIHARLIEKNEEIETIIKEEFSSKVPIFRLPVMIGSLKCNSRFKHPIKTKECLNDDKGYFIIQGNDRVLVFQERNTYNVPYVERIEDSITLKVRTYNEEEGISLSHKIILSSDKDIVCKFPHFNKPTININAIIFLKLFGMDEEEILFHFCNDIKALSIIRFNLLKSRNVNLQKYVYSFFAATIRKDDRENYLNFILHRKIFNHITFEKKGIYLIYLLKKLIGNREVDDIDHISHKRFENDGFLLSELVQHLFKNSIAKTPVDSRMDIRTAFAKINFTNKLHKCFSTGTWGPNNKHDIQFSGVCQIISRINYVSFQSHMKRVGIKNDKRVGLDLRQLHVSNFGFICPVDSPDGKNIGVLKNFSILTKLTIGIDYKFIQNILKPHLKEIGKFFVFLNGRLLGYGEEDTFENIIQVRNDYELQNEISVWKEHDAIIIFCDEGRVVRPFLKNKNPNTLNWDELIKNKDIVYLNAKEIECSRIGMYCYPNKYNSYKDEEYDYYEIHPSMMLSVCSAIIPFANHNPAPRNCYETSMTKQALGVYATNYQYRYDTNAYILNNVQKPLNSTIASRVLKQTEDMAYGINCIVAIACYDHNQEDAVVINRAALERGLFHTTIYKTKTIKESKYTTYLFEELSPPKSKHLKFVHLDERGIVKIGSKIKKGDCLVSKHKYCSKREMVVEDTSEYAEKDEEGIVDDVIEEIGDEGKSVFQIRIRKTVIPEIGDKLASNTCQKGTIGMICNQEDMPFSCQSGMIPDIIIAPYAIPSRMTISMLMDMLIGKVGLLEGKFHDATPFSNSTSGVVEEFVEQLKQCGYDGCGREEMICGKTGRSMNCEVMIGPAYYQRLKHMVGAKIHARVDGSVQTLTLQPSTGRRSGGGLRCGEMEVQNIEAYGLSEFLRERLVDMSDPFNVDVCEECGVIIRRVCPRCKGVNPSKNVSIPYATKLLLQELKAMNINVKIF